MARIRKAGTGIVKLQFLIGDPSQLAALPAQGQMLQGWDYGTDEPMLNGPVSRRVAVIDFDPDTGGVLPGAVFKPPEKGAVEARYVIPEPSNPYSDAFRQVSVFATVLWTMSHFEGKDVLGRKLRWAFEGEQLLVVPRAGRAENAFYHRGSRSVQFFFFETAARTVYACLSPDIVAHETAHAILDGIAPDLYDAVSPQSLALHEAIADLATVIVAVQTKALATRVLALAGGVLRGKKAFSRLAEEFGSARNGGQSQSLRDLENDHCLPGGTGTVIHANEPHALSTILSGALYSLLVEAHEAAVRKALEKTEATEDARFSASGLALFTAGQKFKRMAFRALDYLPPGEIAFADYGRALIAADTAFHPAPSWERDHVKAQFLSRGIVQDTAELDPVAPRFKLPATLDLASLATSDWYAYQFVERLRNKLFIPRDVPFIVRPRLDVTKTTFLSEGEQETRELILKVSWREERKVKEYGLIKKISVTFGTTLVIGWENRTIRALLSTSQLHPSQKHQATGVNETMRRLYLDEAIKAGLVAPGSRDAQLQGDVMKIRSFAQHLHMMEDDHGH